jgi:6-phosphogluconolactonase
MANYELVPFQNAPQLAREAARQWLDELQSIQCGQTGSGYSVALAGGRIAGDFFSAVTELAKGRNLFLDSVHFFWGDERCVPPDDPQSNYRLAREHMLEPLRIAQTQIHRIRGEEEPQKAARLASEELCAVLTKDSAGIPILDMVFLGMGEEGHTASLFPGDEQAQPAHGVYRAVVTPKPPPHRVTLDYAPLAVARQVWVLVSGADKERALKESLEFPQRTPLGRVLASRAQTRVLTDLPVISS